MWLIELLQTFVVTANIKQQKYKGLWWHSCETVDIVIEVEERGAISDGKKEINLICRHRKSPLL